MHCSWNWDSLQHVNKFSLNTLWIIHPSKSFSWKALCLIFFKILKSLYLFWSSFFKGFFEWIFLAFNHMLSSSFNSCRFCLFLSNCSFMTFCANSINFVAFSQLCCNPIRNSSNFGNSICTVRLPFYGCLPKLSMNGVCPIATCFFGILLLQSILFSHSASNWHNVSGKFQFLDLSSLSIHWFEDDMLLIAFSWFSMLSLISP